MQCVSVKSEPRSGSDLTQAAVTNPGSTLETREEGQARLLRDSEQMRSANPPFTEYPMFCRSAQSVSHPPRPGEIRIHDLCLRRGQAVIYQSLGRSLQCGF